MSNLKENQNDQDPDYATPGPSNEAHQKLFEETARTNVTRKIEAIVEKEFSQEIETKEKEILQIEGRLHKALKTLHFLRYVIITDFYNRKQCQIAQSSGESRQSRIHPAIKKIIGKTPKTVDNLFLQTGEVSSMSNNSSSLVEPKKENFALTEIEKRLGNGEELLNDDSTSLKKNTNSKRSRDESFSENCKDAPPKKIPRYVPPKSGIPEPQVPSRGARHKVRKRIVVGNISKWIPPDWREDAASHKWTMYVRGSKENPDISDFVGKIRFFLHPSYRPNDVVEVTSPPFHLSRRGWGEFPLRVQLHFKNPLNKPMDIIHYLKLDRTYTGLQTLGSETVVDVWIKNFSEGLSTCDIRKFEENNEETTISENNQTLGTSNTKIKEEPPDTENVSNDENMIQKTFGLCEKIKEEKELYNESSSHVYLEHDYANTSSGSTMKLFENENNFTISHSPTKNPNDEENLSSTLSSTNGDIEMINNSKNKSSINLASEDIVETSDNISKSLENQNSRLFNGNCDIPPEFRTISNHSGKEITIEACESSQKNSNLEKLTNIKISQNIEKISRNHEYSSSKLQPLKITIPTAFEALRRSTKMPNEERKEILLMRENKSISGDSINSTKNIIRNMNSVDATITSGSLGGNNSKTNNQRAPVSILKKSIVGNKKTIMFNLNPTNSLLLNSTNNIPALKIVEPATINNIRRLYLVEKKTSHRTNVELLPGIKNNCKDSDTVESVTKPKVTLGKDRIGRISKKDNYQEILRSIDEARITDVSALVRFIIRRLPLVTEKAADPEYRKIHPYASACEKDFLDSNVGKQRALEWYRAKRVKSFLKKKGIPEDSQWTIKEIMIWSRLHGHTPILSLPNIAHCSRNTGEKTAEKNFACDTPETSSCTITEPTELLEFLRVTKETKLRTGVEKASEEEEEIIDVENIVSPQKEKSNEENTGSGEKKIISLGIPEKIIPLQSYICETTRQIGIKLEPEEIVPGVMHCSSARIMVKTVQCLLEDLLRSSLAKAWERNNGGCPDVITLEDVRGAILNREEFDLFTNEGLGSRHCPDD